MVPGRGVVGHYIDRCISYVLRMRYSNLGARSPRNIEIISAGGRGEPQKLGDVHVAASVIVCS